MAVQRKIAQLDKQLSVVVGEPIRGAQETRIIAIALRRTGKLLAKFGIDVLQVGVIHTPPYQDAQMC